MIVTNIKQLKEKCTPVSSIEEGRKIGTQLLKELNESENGVGLAANQIGINKRVCIVNVKEPIILINPTITKLSKKMFVIPEGCLSYPNENPILTERHVWVEVEADNYDSKLSFSSEGTDMNDAFECACVQHEIDHLDGVVHHDRRHVVIPYKAPEKIGRNEKVTITNGKETRTMKYKKAKLLLNEDWKFSDIQIPDLEGLHD